MESWGRLSPLGPLSRLSPLGRLVFGMVDSFAPGPISLMLFQVSNEAVDDFAYFYAMIVSALKFVSDDIILV